MDKQDKLRAIRFVIIELAVYGGLVTIYAATVLQFLADPLADLYENDMTWYAWIALALIVIQGFVLEGVTSFLLDRLRITRFD